MRPSRLPRPGYRPPRPTPRRSSRPPGPAVEQARRVRDAAIVAEAEAGIAQVDIIRRTGYGRETIRRILRAGGVAAD